MKILLINHYAGSIYHGMEFRPYYLSKEWVKMGHEIIIVAASFSHLRQKDIEMTADAMEENIDGIRYIWLRTPKYSGNGLGRIRNMLSFLRKLYTYLPKITANFAPDAVIASSTYPLDSYPARWIAKKHGAKFVFELHDLWPQVLGKMSKWHPFIMIMQMAEDYWCKNADVVISLLPNAYKHLVTRGMKMEKYHVIPNGISVDEWQAKSSGGELPELHKESLSTLKKSGKTIVGYVGGHGVSNGLDMLVDAAARTSGFSKIQFVLVGKGPEKAKLEEKTKGLNLPNITFLPPVLKKAVPVLLKQMDILVCNVNETPLCQYGMSLNKIFDYMMAEKPVLWSSNVSNDFVAESHCGFTVPSGDLISFCDKLYEMSDMKKEFLDAMGVRGKEYILKQYTYPKLARKFIDAL
ncbi:MAG: glycosyltransferase family 4 protein [Cloacibacillus sp.]